MGCQHGGASGDNMAAVVIKTALSEMARLKPLESIQKQRSVGEDCIMSWLATTAPDAGVKCICERGLSRVQVFAVAGFLRLDRVIHASNLGEVSCVFKKNAHIEKLFRRLHDLADITA